MRKIVMALAFAGVFGVSGCGTLSTVLTASTTTVTAVAPDAMMAAKKGLTAAHDAHAAAALALTVAAQTGWLHGQDALTAKKWLDDSEAYLSAADDLVALGDAPGIEAKIGAANALVAKVQALVGTK